MKTKVWTGMHIEMAQAMAKDTKREWYILGSPGYLLPYIVDEKGLAEYPKLQQMKVSPSGKCEYV